ncbi:hypothetical protein A0H81_12115 [Grifola frondosa]|uniref:Uncharacterized protein n=1 Tax=Grifola frondosa TaxID=5627 RepID=A0A1C7LUW8_GRIFR|nr:hypothetical protein A0H81_12115 [Grifola frondosa]
MERTLLLSFNQARGICALPDVEAQITRMQAYFQAIRGEIEGREQHHGRFFRKTHARDILAAREVNRSDFSPASHNSGQCSDAAPNAVARVQIQYNPDSGISPLAQRWVLKEYTQADRQAPGLSIFCQILVLIISYFWFTTGVSSSS